MHFRSVAILTLLSCLLVFTTVTYLSCNKPEEKPKDPCQTVECVNGGECYEGTCNCQRGFKGANCELRWQTKYLGTWVMSDSSVDGLNAQLVSIRPSKTDATIIVVDSFWIYKAVNITALLLNENEMQFQEEQNLYPGYHENYILKSGTAQIDPTDGIIGTFTVTHEGEPDKLHSFSMNR